MTLTKIEKEYVKYIPEFVKEMHKSIFDKEMMNRDYYNMLNNDYEVCFVGSIRQKLGLSKKYYSYNHPNTKCKLCEELADGFLNIEQSKNEDKYIDILKEFKEHLKDVHKKEL